MPEQKEAKDDASQYRGVARKRESMHHRTSNHKKSRQDACKKEESVTQKKREQECAWNFFVMCAAQSLHDFGLQFYILGVWIDVKRYTCHAQLYVLTYIEYAFTWELRTHMHYLRVQVHLRLIVLLRLRLLCDDSTQQQLRQIFILEAQTNKSMNAW